MAFLLYAAAASTDWLDGQIARRTGTVTEIGKAIDPLVDRLLIASGVIGLYIEQRLPLWVLGVLVREMSTCSTVHGGLSTTGSHAGHVPGKIDDGGPSCAGFSLLILYWPEVPLFGGIQAGSALRVSGVALSVSTAVQYTFKARSMVNKQVAEESLA